MTYTSEDFKDRIRTHLNKHIKAPNHTVMKTKILKEAYKFVLERPNLYPIKYWDKILIFILCYYGNNKTLNIDYGIRQQGDRLINQASFPALLEKNTPYISITEPGRVETLTEFLTNKNHPKEESLLFIKDVFQNVTI